MPVDVKICGITDDESMQAAIEAGVDMVGLVFFPPSPRAVSPERAAELVDMIPEEVLKVGLFVDADDATLEATLAHVRLDLLQFHGSETPERIEAVRLEFGVEVMKMIPVSCLDDLARAEPYLEVADRLLFDAKAPTGAVLPGGNALAFDWSILAGRTWPLPWVLAGGLNADNVAEAIRISGATAVDVSSGVESAPGLKDPDKICAFIAAAKGT
jgi:phosphoribosylanthranilate isomerase